jgi:hypothetical protein
MSRVLPVLLCLCSLAFAHISNCEALAASAPSSAVQVVYIAGGSTLTTYNIEPQTLQATQVGTLALPQSVYPNLVTSPNGQFLYYTAYQNVSDDGLTLYVYDTNASGVPAATPVQQIKAGSLAGLSVHPSGKFIYSIAMGPPNQQQQTTPFSVVRNLINPKNGKLSEPATEATYQLETGSSSNDCYFSLLGFNSEGTTMYDGIICSGPHGSGSATYNERSVDLQTGVLGPDQELYNYSYYAGSETVNVQFANNLLFAFVGYFNQGPNANLVDVYQTSNPSTPAINCTTAMLAICGDFGSALAHPSGEYVFLSGSTSVTDIGAVNLSTQQISQTSSIPYYVGKFSPDGTIVYATTYVNSTSEIELYGFDVSTGQVTQGGSLSEPSNEDAWWTTERY